ncbi:MAG: hypothetical protein LBF97_08490 [Elusimicrobiota bacterium]|jgi:hypothetical protein|nr:hypothetical protein [Elusimicrobiota bacterium]
MSIIKSFAVGNGDMFYIKHNTPNFTIIDCCLSDNNREKIIDEIKEESKNKIISRFISTHPDEDHIQQLNYLDDESEIINFYCVKNEATKLEETDSFKRYCKLRDSEKKAFYISKGCYRKWMNRDGEDENGHYIYNAGINILWPIISNEYFKRELENVKNGTCPNNISPIIKYSIKNSVTVLWMGDLENDFMENIIKEITFPKINLLFAPHHGRKSGRIPDAWLKEMDPDIIIMGEAPSKNLDYYGYDDYNKITQNSAIDIIFECIDTKMHIYVSNKNYSVDFLDKENIYNNYNCFYLGTLNLKL